MKTKYWAIGLSLALVLVLVMVACSQQASQEPQEPAQTAQTTEPVNVEPTAAPMEVKQEVTPTAAPTTPTEGEQDPKNEVDPADPVDPAGEPEPVVELFTEVNETVYATGTVNLRASWSAESEKLGSLSTGDVVTRTGIAIEGTEAEGWSRIQLSDGSTVYVSNKYLSTTKPVVQNTNNGGGGITQTTQPTGQGGGTTDTQPSGSTYTDEEIEQYIRDSLAGLTTTGPHIKPGDPGWDDYVHGLASSLQPTN